MSKFCFFSMASERLTSCGDRCAMYDWDKGGCLIAKSLDIYIKNNTLLTVKKPKVEHDYDEYGVDWYPHGYDDIAP